MGFLREPFPSAREPGGSTIDLRSGTPTERPGNWVRLGPDVIGTPTEPLLPRKEVIQPHLPVQLPCYDFVPVTEPDLGAYFPCGLAQRLQLFSASMT